MKAVLLGIVMALVAGGVAAAAWGVNPAHAPNAQVNSAGWVTLASQNEPRQEMAVAELNGRIYAIGGFRADSSSATTVEAYDPSTDSWQTMAPLPIGLNHPLAASCGGRIYVIGGHPESGAEAVDSTYSYDPSSNSWTERARMPTARGSLAVGVIEGKIYAVGGAPDRREQDFAVYDPDADIWTPLPSMPTPRNHLAAGAINGKFYAVGGRSGQIGGITAILEEYDPSAGAWTERASMPTARGGIGGLAVDGQLYVFGGEGNRNRATGVFDEVEAYDPSTNSWRSLAPMGIPRHGIQAAAIGNRIYIPGGAAVEGFGVVPTNQALDVP